MTISAALSMTLNAAGTIMAPAHDPWWIIASAAVTLHGVDPGRVADVDVLLSVADAKRVLPTIGVETRGGAAHDMFRSSLFGTWFGAALPIEFMAGFHRRSGTEWVAVRPTTRQAIRLDRVVVFVPEKAELHAILTAFGRPKDMERAQLLAALS